jgi:hypothetical protein
MFAVLLVLAWLLLTLVVAVHRKRLGVGQGVREAAVVATALCATLVVAFTEALSIAAQLTEGPVRSCWAALDLALLGWLVAQRRQLRGWVRCAPALSLGEWILLGLCGILVAIAGLIAAVSPPSNWDSMVYHLPRQIHWIQQASVAHFPATSSLQTGMPPLAEFISVHLMILSGGDGWANLVQWFALAMTLTTVSLIARDLGLSRAAQMLSALLVATIPVAFLQAMNTKNDLVVCLWLCQAAWWCVRLWGGNPWNLAQATLTGLTLGLLALTKGTGSLFALPIIVVGGLGLLVKQRPLAAKAAVLVAAMAALVNLGHVSRNYRAYHSVLGAPVSPAVANATHHPRAIISNLVRNLALHLGSSSESRNASLLKGVLELHRWLGIDVSDPQTTFNEPFGIRYLPNNEDVAPAPVHVLLIGIFTLLLPFYLWRASSVTRVYLILPYACCFLFCLQLKWQLFHARLQLPIFCLFAPLLAGLCAGRWGKVATGVTVASCLLALNPAVFRGSPKSLFTSDSVLRADRLTMLFTARPELRQGMQAVANELVQLHPASVSLLNFNSEWEYPLERLILDRLGQRPFFSAFQPCEPAVPNVPPRYEEAPDVVVGIRSAPSVLVHSPTGKEYVATRYCMPYTVYLPRERAEQVPIDVAQFPFYGWEALEGWRQFEGPIPYWGFPVVRWGLAPTSRLSFESDGRSMQLHAECRANNDLLRYIRLKLNGSVIQQQPLDAPPSFTSLSLLLHPQLGRNELVLEYGGEEAPPGTKLGVVFRKLQIVPR